MTLATLLYIVWDVNPDMFVIPFLNHPVRWYGVSWAVGFLISQQIMYFIYRREGRKSDEIDTLTIYMVIAGMVGARLGHVLFYDAVEYLHDPVSILKVWEGGLASHGGTLGVLIALIFFARKTGVGYLWIVDRLTIAGALTGGLIRMGNLMNSEMVGVPTSVPWAFIFTSVDNIPRHPAQLYEALYCFVLSIALFLIWWRYRHRVKSGFMTGIFLVVLFTLRFVDEFFKINQVGFEDDMVLNMGQLLSIPFVIGGSLILFRSLRKNPIETAD